MKISAFTFIRNGQMLGYPFVESIKSVLPIVDEFIVNIGPSEDNTEDLIKKIDNKKIKIIKSSWAEKMNDKGFVYGHQKMIAQFNCSGDWLFYVEGDEVYHEKDIKKIKSVFNKYKNDKNVEALAFNYFHFYGNKNSYLNSPGWYRTEVRAIKSNIRTYAPDGLFWVVLDKNKKGRYPKAKLIDAYCYHYGWVRTEEQMNMRRQKVGPYWGNNSPEDISYLNIDQKIIKQYTGTHPLVMVDWLRKAKDIFTADPNYKLTRRDRRHRILLKIEKFFSLDLSKKHYKLIK